MEFDKEIETTYENIRRNIKSLLDISELKSARKLSFLIGKEGRYMARVLSGEREITFATVIAISKIFKVSIDLLCISEREFIIYNTKPDEITKLVNCANNAWAEYKKKK